MMPSGTNYTLYDELSELPAFDPGLDNDRPPASIYRLRQQLSAADGIIICTPEYAYGVPGALKNALDWTVSSASFSGKPAALITASTGGENAHESMIKILGAINAKLRTKTTLLIPFIRSKMDEEGNITDRETAQKLLSLFNELMAIIA